MELSCQELSATARTSKPILELVLEYSCSVACVTGSLRTPGSKRMYVVNTGDLSIFSLGPLPKLVVGLSELTKASATGAKVRLETGPADAEVPRPKTMAIAATAQNSPVVLGCIAALRNLSRQGKDDRAGDDCGGVITRVIGRAPRCLIASSCESSGAGVTHAGLPNMQTIGGRA